MKLLKFAPRTLLAALATSGMLIIESATIPAAAQVATPAVVQPGYAELVELAENSTVVVRAQIRKQTALKPQLAPGVPPGWVRLLIEADTQALIAGESGIGESLRYLVDVRTDSKGKPPKLKKQVVLLFADRVPGKPADLQLVFPSAQYAYDAQFESRIRDALVSLHDPNGPPTITGVREAMSVAGNLAGESETQVFLSTLKGEPVSLSVIRRPGMAPQWGVSWTEIVDQSAAPPPRDTLAWYRLACYLPRELPTGAIIASDGTSRMRAVQDYRFVLDQLGACQRGLG